MIYEWSTTIYENKQLETIEAWTPTIEQKQVTTGYLHLLHHFSKAEVPPVGGSARFGTGLVTTFWADHVYQQLKKRNNNTFTVAPIKRSRLLPF